MSHAEKLNPHEASMFAGHVLRIEGEAVVVRGDRVESRARRAPSCLLLPAAGDRVLCATTGEGRVFVLAVLERDEETAQRWVASGDVVVESQAGRVDVAAPAGVGIATSAEVSVQAKRGRFAISRLSVLGEEALVEVLRTRLVSRAIETLAETVTQTATRVARVVTEIEHVRARQIDIAAEKALMIHAENAVVTAKELVKMDGEAVQLG